MRRSWSHEFSEALAIFRPVILYNRRVFQGTCQVCWRMKRWRKRSNPALSKPVMGNKPSRLSN